jgi:hypothetical protein
MEMSIAFDLSHAHGVQLIALARDVPDPPKSMHIAIGVDGVPQAPDVTPAKYRQAA